MDISDAATSAHTDPAFTHATCAATAREFKLVEGDPVNINDLKFFSQGIRPGAETATHNSELKATHAAVVGLLQQVVSTRQRV